MSDKVGGRKSVVGVIIDWGVPILIAVILALLIRQFVFFKVKIPSLSMVPTLNVNDQLIATRIYILDNLKTGDIIYIDGSEIKGKAQIKVYPFSEFGSIK